MPRNRPALFVEQPIVLYGTGGSRLRFRRPVRRRRDARSRNALSAKRRPMRRSSTRSPPMSASCARRSRPAGARCTNSPAAETGRVMDMRWLKSPGARLRLVGVVNRLDRRDFHDLRGEAGCGEMRLIFRLAYSFRKDGKGKILSSRMPFNFNAVYDVLPDRRWRLRGGGAALDSRPTASSPMPHGWPAGRSTASTCASASSSSTRRSCASRPARSRSSAGRPSISCASSASTATGSPSCRWRTRPTWRGFRQDAALKAELAAYVRDNAQAIDQGVYMIPDRLLARKAISYSTFGNARQVNHPFSPLLSPQDFAGLDLSAGQPRALARGAAGAARQRHLPGLPPVGRDGRLPLHRPRRQVHLAAQPHRGGDFAAFPRRAAAPRRLCRGGRGRARAEPVQAAVVRPAGQLGGRRRHLLCRCRSLACLA